METRTARTERVDAAAGRRADITGIRVGDTASCDVRIGDDAIAAFAALSGDTNPLHLDARVAAEYGFERPVAHGMLTLAAISRLIGTELPGPGSLWVSHTVRFPAPVLAGDRVIARVTVTQVSVATGLVVLHTEARNTVSDRVVLAGVAHVKVPGIDAQ